MTEKQVTTLERLTTSVASTVVAAALIGVFVLLQQLQQSQAEEQKQNAVMAVKLEQISQSVDDQRTRIRRLENRARFGAGGGHGWEP